MVERALAQEMAVAVHQMEDYLAQNTAAMWSVAYKTLAVGMQELARATAAQAAAVALAEFQALPTNSQLVAY